MKIVITKTTIYKCGYTVTRSGGSVDQISLETKTYLLHDICHYVVEKNLGYSTGFWGMLAKGYSFGELLGKDNPLTAELRFIEQLVGPVQSVFSGNIPKEKFGMFIQHIDFKMPENMLDNCLTEIDTLMKQWQQLAIGQQLVLEWRNK